MKNLTVLEKKETVLSIDDVSIQFGSFKAIKGVSTQVAKSEIRFFIGPNGAGKTTILDAICGKNKISSGQIFYHENQQNLEVSKMNDYRIACNGIGRKFQAPSIFKGLTVKENMEIAVISKRSIFHTTFFRLSSEQKDLVAHVLKLIGLEDKANYYPEALSHGEKQWLEIGMLMAARPQLMLLDEPVAGMGRRETEKTAELLLEIKKDCSVIVVEHDMQFARDVSDSVTVFHEGQILDEGTMTDIQNNPQVIDVYLGRGGEKAC